MSIIGINFTNIEAKSEKLKNVGNINIDSSPKLTYIDKKDAFFGIKDTLLIGFNFTTTYKPKVGSIKINGEIVYQSENYKKILEKWKKDKKIEGEPAIEILNAIFKKCLVKAIELSVELRLPSPVELPFLKRKEK